MHLIGFIGPKGSGKDTSYSILKELKKVDGKISFAGPLKAICGEVFNLHFNLLNDPILKERELREPITLTGRHIRQIRNLCEEYVNPVTPEGIILYRSNAISTVGLEGRVFKTPRELMQIIGTELIRDRVWKGWHRAAAFSTKALSKLKTNGTYAVTDVRFLDEHEFLTERFEGSYKAFYVSRPEAEKALEGATHPSELETQRIRAVLTDSVIYNSGTLEDLTGKLTNLDFGFNTATTDAAPPKGSRFRFAPRGEG